MDRLFNLLSAAAAKSGCLVLLYIGLTAFGLGGSVIPAALVTTAGPLVGVSLLLAALVFAALAQLPFFCHCPHLASPHTLPEPRQRVAAANLLLVAQADQEPERLFPCDTALWTLFGPAFADETLRDRLHPALHRRLSRLAAAQA